MAYDILNMGFSGFSKVWNSQTNLSIPRKQKWKNIGYPEINFIVINNYLQLLTILLILSIILKLLRLLFINLSVRFEILPKTSCNDAFHHNFHSGYESPVYQWNLQRRR